MTCKYPLHAVRYTKDVVSIMPPNSKVEIIEPKWKARKKRQFFVKVKSLDTVQNIICTVSIKKLRSKGR